MTASISISQPKSIVTDLFEQIEKHQQLNLKIKTISFKVFSELFVSISSKDTQSISLSLRKDTLSCVSGEVICKKALSRLDTLYIVHAIFADLKNNTKSEHSMAKITCEFTISSTKDKCSVNQPFAYKFSAHPESQAWIDAIYT